MPHHELHPCIRRRKPVSASLPLPVSQLTHICSAPRYIWPCFLIWGQDRLCRYIRYALLTNFHGPNHAPAHVTLLKDGNTLRITVCREFGGISKLQLGGWRVGQHMFLAFPTIGPIESHPFTILSVCEPVHDTSADGAGVEHEGEDQGLRELEWIVRVRNGFTARLRDQVISKNGALDIPVFMDGPYGAPADITPFNTCIFIAGKPFMLGRDVCVLIQNIVGGSGVSYTLPRMTDIL